MALNDFWGLPVDTPFPTGLMDNFLARRAVLDFVRGGADYNTTDWTQTLAGGGTAVLGAGGPSASYPGLILTTAADSAQAAAVRAAKWIQLPGDAPGAGVPIIQSVCFEFIPTSVMTTHFLAFGIASGTPTQFQDTTGSFLNAAAGMGWQLDTGGTWKFCYRADGGALQTLISGAALTMVSNRLVRCGFTVVQDRLPGSPRTAQIFPFLQSPGTPASGVTFPNPLAQAGTFRPDERGVYLDATLGDAAATQCGLAFSAVGDAASSRSILLTRILYADDFAR